MYATLEHVDPPDHPGKQKLLKKGALKIPGGHGRARLFGAKDSVRDNHPGEQNLQQSFLFASQSATRKKQGVLKHTNLLSLLPHPSTYKNGCKAEQHNLQKHSHPWR